jgi:hypothetical protein
MQSWQYACVYGVARVMLSWILDDDHDDHIAIADIQ